MMMSTCQQINPLQLCNTAPKLTPKILFGPTALFELMEDVNGFNGKGI